MLRDKIWFFTLTPLLTNGSRAPAIWGRPAAYGSTQEEEPPRGKHCVFTPKRACIVIVSHSLRTVEKDLGPFNSGLARTWITDHSKLHTAAWTRGALACSSADSVNRTIQCRFVRGSIFINHAGCSPTQTTDNFDSEYFECNIWL